jgi:hypothetical protein
MISLPRFSRARIALAAVAATLLLPGCAAPARVFVNGEADPSFYAKIAVIPFSNLSGQAFAGERVMRAFVTELVIAQRYDIVDAGELRAVLDRIGGLPSVEGQYDPEKLKQAAKEVGAKGFLRGAVTEYGMQRESSNETPVLAFDVELVDVETAKEVWRVSISKRGKGRTPILGGGGTRTLSRLTEEACREVVKDLEGKAF